jgi:hypothetical protein
MFGMGKGEAAVLAKIRAMPAPYGEMGERLHRAILQSAPTLEPVWRWGMPIYRQDGEDVCFMRATKIMQFGFSERAKLTAEGGAPMQPMVWWLTSLDKATEARIGALVRNATSQEATA